MILFHVLVFTIIVAVVSHIYLRYGRKGRMLEALPGPPALPIFGNLFQFLVSKTEDLTPLMDECCKLYKPLCRLRAFHLSGVMILNPDDAEVVLTSHQHTEKSSIYKFIQPWLGEGLLISKGSKWHHRRRILTPAFHYDVLQKYFNVLEEHGNFVVESLHKKTEKTIELLPFVTYHTLSAICETAMGISLESIDPVIVEKYREAVFFMGESMIYRVLRPWCFSDFIFDNFTARGRKQKKILKLLHGFSRKIIHERMEYYRKTGKTLNDLTSVDENSDDMIKGKKKRLAMLDLLISASWDGLIDNEGIAEEVDTFVFEGHDTSAMGLLFVLQLLAEFKDVQEKARAEVNKVWDACEGKLSIRSLNELSYLECCIRESLRLYPSVPFISRALHEDLQLKNGAVPAGTMVDVFIYEIHRDPNYWPEPDKFNPDRFLPEKILDRHPFSYIPFSGGPRNCIGQKFAMMELKMFTMFILKNFELEATIKHNDIVRLWDLVCRPTQKIFVKFIPIKKKS